MYKLLTALYRLLLLGVLSAIAFYTYLIYQRMPMTMGEWVTIKDRTARRNVIADRMPVVKIPDELDVNVTNESLDVDVGNDVNVNVTNPALDVDVGNEVEVSGRVSIER